MLGVDTSATLIDDRLEQFAHGISRVHREMTRTFLDIAKADDPGAALNRLMTFVGAALPELPG